jgi:hypothetical protein
VVPEDEGILQFGDVYIGKIDKNYLSQYVRGERSRDKMYGIRRENEGIFKIGNSLLSMEENRDITIRGET